MPQRTRAAGVPSPRHARCSALACAVTLTLVLTGCSWGTTPLPAVEAVEHYDAIAEDLLSVLTHRTDDAGGFQDHLRGLEESGGQCLYHPGSWRSGWALAEPGGDGWDDLAADVDPILNAHGFADLGRPFRRGALQMVRATDEHGAELIISQHGELSIRDAVVDAQPCTEAALGL